MSEPSAIQKMLDVWRDRNATAMPRAEGLQPMSPLEDSFQPEQSSWRYAECLDFEAR
jgi:hypothetical protein